MIDAYTAGIGFPEMISRPDLVIKDIRRNRRTLIVELYYWEPVKDEFNALSNYRVVEKSFEIKVTQDKVCWDGRWVSRERVHELLKVHPEFVRGCMWAWETFGEYIHKPAERIQKLIDQMEDSRRWLVKEREKNGAIFRDREIAISEMAKSNANLLGESVKDMPKVPKPSEKWRPDKKEFSGIYFYWDSRIKKVHYVGKSSKVIARVKSHHVIPAEHRSSHVSWLKMKKSEIHFAELYYIWLCRPCLNNEGTRTMEERFRELEEEKKRK